MWKLKEQARISPSSKRFLERLSDNLPETQLDKKAIDYIDAIYAKVIGQLEENEHNYCYQMELSYGWPGGERMKRHEAQRIMLDWLLQNQNERPIMTDEEASVHFYGSLSNRPSWIQLLRLIYEKV